MGEGVMNRFNSQDMALALLSMAAGTMDSLSFLKLANVFTSAMSGNTILFGLALGQGRIPAASHSVAAFCGYVLGVTAAAWPLSRATGKIGISRATEWVLAGEAVFLGAFAVVWLAYGGPSSVTLLYALILLSAVGMGLQGATARHLNVTGISTVVFTSTLTNFISALAAAVFRPRHHNITMQTWRQMLMFGIYLVSAVLTGLAASSMLWVMVCLPFALVAAALVIYGLRAPVPA
jgi:uncharacterized membrane protein YoaK (UPF0700 family)